MRFQKITIVGVGLLGGSIGLAARERRLASEVAGFVRRAASLKDCETGGRGGLRHDGFAGRRFKCRPRHPLHAVVADAGARRRNASGLETRRDCHRRWQRQGGRCEGSLRPHPKGGRAFYRQSSDGWRRKNGCAGGEGGFVCERGLCRDANEETPTRRRFDEWNNFGNPSVRGRCGSRRNSTTCLSAVQAICRTLSRRLWRTGFWTRRGQKRRRNFARAASATPHASRPARLKCGATSPSPTAAIW